MAKTREELKEYYRWWVKNRGRSEKSKANQKAHDLVRSKRKDRTEYRKKWPTMNPVKRKIQVDSYHKKLKLLVIGHYTQGKNACMCCGESHLEFLSVDHINGGGAKHRKEVGGSIIRYLKRNNFPEGFRI